LEYVGMDVDRFVGEAKAQPRWAQERIISYLLREKERAVKGEISPSSVGNVKKPVKLLLEMNDVSGINWKKISRILPSARRYAIDRAPTVDELRLLLENTELRFQAILLIMASSGVRIGAWEHLNWGHVEPIKRDGQVVAAKLRVYAGDPEEYITFITPEAYRKLEQYIQLRASHGEKITKDSPLIRDRWRTERGVSIGDIAHPRRLRPSGVKRLFEDMLWKFGLRKEKKRRHEFSIHSLRKFFKTRAEQVMKPINVETLMGHSTGVSDSYYRPTEKDLLEDYLKAVPLLTISEAEEVRRQSQLSRQQLEEKLRRLEDLVSQLITEKGGQALSQGHSHIEGTSNRNISRKVVKAEEVERFMDEGWEPIMTLPDGRVVMKFL
ncbi:MAG: site-specific integrase, partial [Candidatus Bathyarchaeia archaeon]